MVAVAASRTDKLRKSVSSLSVSCSLNSCYTTAIMNVEGVRTSPGQAASFACGLTEGIKTSPIPLTWLTTSSGNTTSGRPGR